MPLKIELWDYHKKGDHVLLGDLQNTIQEIRTNEVKRSYDFKSKNG